MKHEKEKEFDEGARLHLCMDKWNHSTPIRKRLNLIQAVWDKPITTGLAPVLGAKTRSLEEFSQYFQAPCFCAQDRCHLISI